MTGRLAVLFPGVGYHCERPLMYYAARLARSAGWQTMPLSYSGFPERVRGDGEKLRRCMEIARAQTEALLADVRWEDLTDALFIGKSIGTVAAARYACAHALRARFVLLTPLMETFAWPLGDAVAFHGDADPWADTAAITAACAARGIPLYLTPGANHSLETGNVAADLGILAETMARVEAFIRGEDGNAGGETHACKQI